MLMSFHFDLLNNLHHPLSQHYLLHRDAADCYRYDDDDVAADRNANHHDRYSKGDWVRTFATITIPQVERFLRQTHRWRPHTGNSIIHQSLNVILARWMTIVSSMGSRILTSVVWLSISVVQCLCSSHWRAHQFDDGTCMDSKASYKDMVHQLRLFLILISSIPLNLATSLYPCQRMRPCWSNLSNSDGDLSWQQSRVDSQATGMFLYLL